jgi:hypothetical protein
MRSATLLASCALVAIGTGLGLGAVSSSCSTLATGTGGTGGAGGMGGATQIGPMLQPGEICSDPTSNLLKVRVMPATVFLPTCTPGSTCATRTVTIVVDPDTCAKSAVKFTSADPSIAPAPPDTSVDLHKDAIAVTLTGGAKAGTTTINVEADVVGSMGPIGAAMTSLQVVVSDPTVPACSGTAQTPALMAGDSVTLGGASISLPMGANDPDQGSFLWGVQPFPATIACAAQDLVIPGYEKLGPAITFGPVAQTFQREVPLSVPINPALMPSTARLRHVRLAYSGPAFLKPRTVPVADPAIQMVNGAWALTFKAPRLGTYQAVVPPAAGSATVQRTMTYRAVMGISMGGGGAASFGFRHHNLFDVVAPLGGPVAWTFMLDFIYNNQLGGFRPIASGTTLADIQITATPCSTNADCKSDETCVGVLTSPAMQGECRVMPTVADPYAHPETFNTWWYEYPKAGNGGSFDRNTYTQIFRDLSTMFGNPNSENLTPGAGNLPAGVLPTDPSVVGDHPGTECATPVDPVCPTSVAPMPWPNGALVVSCGQDSDCGDAGQSCMNGMCGPPCDLTMQQELQDDCPVERCMHTLVLQNYYDAEYNPDGTFPVITVCDGSPQNPALTPYSDTWGPTGNNQPLEVGLAVDYNGNGMRDELEPVIRSGHEPWDDFGTDGIPSSMEPGYVPGVNDDPSGDDYNPQYNPSGTENDHRYEDGEKFYDYGIDGVPNTPQQPPGGWAKPGDGYDVGEGDGQFTVSSGLQRFWDRDAWSIARQMVKDPSTNIPAGDLDDGALSRLDVWTDGGLRDLFNFDVDAQHLVGALYTRGRDATYLTGATQAPGLDPTNPDAYDPKLIDYADLPGVVLQRYGEIDPSPTDIEDGSGQHVGTASELTARLQSALYFIGARWRNHPELSIQAQPSNANPDPKAPQCEVLGTCTISFTSSTGRTGPVGISFPPGYANKDLQSIRYPVIYLLHGYGQQPTDLEAAIVLLQNWMNSSLNSGASRLPKAIVVYVDGRCRLNANGTSECIQGTFFGDAPPSVPNGAQDETWWLELMDYLDQNYRTLGGDLQSWTE